MNSSGLGVTLLTIVFLLLKVFGYIAWSWLWVFSPLWIAGIVWVVTMVILFILALKDG